MTPDELDDGRESQQLPYSLPGYDSWKLRSPWDESPEAYDAHAEGKWVCPRGSRCEVCWPSEVKP